MTSEDSARSAVPIDFRRLTWASVLIGLGAVLWLAGVSLGSAAVVRAAQRWIRELDQPPKELARSNWKRFMHAKSVGTEAWRNGSTVRLSAASNS
jgi:hypothetical protein